MTATNIKPGEPGSGTEGTPGTPTIAGTPAAPPTRRPRPRTTATSSR